MKRGEFGFRIARTPNEYEVREVARSDSGAWVQTGQVYNREPVSAFGREKLRGIAQKLRRAGLVQLKA